MFPAQCHRPGGAGPQRAFFNTQEFTETTGELLRLWCTDGSAANTRPLVAGADGSEPFSMVPWRDSLFFSAIGDGVGRELWVTDGSAAGTGLVTDFEPGPDSSGASILGAVGDLLLVSAFRSGVGSELWVTDGTAEGTRRVAPVPDPTRRIGARYGDGQRVYFYKAAERGGDHHLWVSDGTAEGTRRLTPDPGEFPAEVEGREVTLLPDGRAIFDRRDPQTGVEPWVTDGTPEGTRLLRDICSGECSSRRTRTLFLADRDLVGPGAVFNATDPDHGWELWTSDGTEAGTRRLLDACPGPCDGVGSYYERTAGDGVGYLLMGPEGERRLWVTDGTEAGTRPVTERTFPRYEVASATLGDGRTVLSLDDGVHGHEPWVTDGTAEGTFLLRDVNRGPAPAPPPACVADDHTLCLLDGRFRVRAAWRDPRTGREGQAGARPFPGSQRTGVFWFFGPDNLFGPDNVELIVKQLDGRAVNGFFWTFYGALTDVESWIEVEDVESGARRTYHNPPREICGRGDSAAFPDLAPAAAPFAVPGERRDATSGTALALLGGRFEVEVEWADQRTGENGVGTAVPGSDRSGYFWFFTADNIELVVKVLDGRPVNGRFWVFYGGLSDVGYTIRGTDTVSERLRLYHNPPGEICGDADTAAF